MVCWAAVYCVCVCDALERNARHESRLASQAVCVCVCVGGGMYWGPGCRVSVMLSGSKCLCNEVYLHRSLFYGEGLPTPYG